MGRRVVAVANPVAGLRRRGDPARRAIEAFLRVDPRARIDLVHTEQPGDAKRIAAEAAAGGVDLVLAVGGDGTAHEAANGLLGTRTALGVIPAGTMNLLARVLGLPIDPEAAARRLAMASHVREVRPGRVGERIFLLMAGVGFDAWVLRALLDDVRGKIRFRDYVRGALTGLRTYPFPSLRCRIGDEEIGFEADIENRFMRLLADFVRAIDAAPGREAMNVLQTAAYGGWLRESSPGIPLGPERRDTGKKGEHMNDQIQARYDEVDDDAQARVEEIALEYAKDWEIVFPHSTPNADVTRTLKAMALGSYLRSVVPA